ncbi:uncharacterized protein UV8b_02549 [Ustilaginoidea virens]|uniref:Protein kinase domain-containing protein n=1 Tax=Ustilaginoidea virens TaxID=1159556 RepID=A0A8E5HN44_USTVR|nr:uncharacterized protein UV8b_02549 [Ustilaginoidea virens]QUC18308.1 hypothetical protein UV8b_02549 [Ustilaginoidea virens]
MLRVCGAGAIIFRLQSASDRGQNAQTTRKPSSYCANSRGLTDDGILLEFAPNGNLRDYYLVPHPETSLQQRMTWCVQAAQGINYIHSTKRVRPSLPSPPRQSPGVDDNLDLKLADSQGQHLSADGVALLDALSLESSKSCPPRTPADRARVKTDLTPLAHGEGLDGLSMQTSEALEGESPQLMDPWLSGICDAAQAASSTPACSAARWLRLNKSYDFLVLSLVTLGIPYLGHMLGVRGSTAGHVIVAARKSPPRLNSSYPWS